MPDVFSPFTDIGIIELSHNKFSGKLPNSVASLAPELVYRELGQKAFAIIPSFLGNFEAPETWYFLEQLHMNCAKKFWKHDKVFNLDLSLNSLVDPFPLMNVKMYWVSWFLIY